MNGVAKYLVCLALLLVCLPCMAQVHVRGYFRKNGTYVAPYVRSSPNHTSADNYSTRGNFNPYTGKAGTQSPSPYSTYAAPAPSYSADAAYWNAVAAREQLRIQELRFQAQLQLLQMQAQRKQAIEQELANGRNPKSLDATELAFLSQSTTANAYGDACTQDCSGHDAGYQWAEDNDITDADDCGGSSESFIEGCEAYAAEQEGDE